MGINEVLILLLGWFLGLLAPSITNKIQEIKKSKQLKESILNEIDEFQITMASLVYQVESNFNKFDHDLINFLLPIYKNYKGVKEIKDTINGLEELVKLSSEELQKIENYKKNSYDSLSMKKYDLPYLKSKIHELSIFENEFQRKAFELLFLLDVFNEEVEESRFFFKLTFDGGISPDNHQIASNELDNKYRSISQRARIILKKIELL